MPPGRPETRPSMAVPPVLLSPDAIPAGGHLTGEAPSAPDAAPELPPPPAPDGPGLFGEILPPPMPAPAPPGTPYRVLARKYRPTRFEDVIGQEAMVRILRRAFQLGRVAHAFMLTGVRGTGKTTTARILARCLTCIGRDGTGGPTAEPCGVCANCTAILADRHPDVVEMDAASRTGVEDVREIIEGTRFRPMQARAKVFIIDEVHMLSRNAFNALLKTLEEPPPHVTFVFATTELRKVPVTVLSRCQRFDLRRVSVAELSAHFARIATAEGVSVASGALEALARAADGSVRDGLSLLDQAIAQGSLAGGAEGVVSAEAVADMLGLAERGLVFDLFEAVMAGRPAEALAITARAHAHGADLGLLLGDMLELSHTLTRLRTVPGLRDSAELPELERTRGAALADRLSVPALGRAWQMLLKGMGEVEAAPDRSAAAEMVLIRLCHVAELPLPAELVRRLSGQAGEPAGTGSSAIPVVAAAPPDATAIAGPAPGGEAPGAVIPQPVIPGPDMARPDMTRPDMAEPGRAGSAMPEAVTPKSLIPGSATTGPGMAGSGMAGSVMPGAATPGVVTSGVVTSGPATPGPEMTRPAAPALAPESKASPPAAAILAPAPDAPTLVARDTAPAEPALVAEAVSPVSPAARDAALAAPALAPEAVPPAPPMAQHAPRGEARAAGSLALAPPPARLEAPEPVAAPLADAPAPDTAPAPPPAPAGWRDVAALVAAGAQPMLHAHLLHSVHLVRFAPPVIELRPEPGAPRDLAPRLAAILAEATGTRWTIALSAAPGEPTLAEQGSAAAAARSAAAADHPLVRAILDAFPGARLGPVRDSTADAYGLSGDLAGGLPLAGEAVPEYGDPDGPDTPEMPDDLPGFAPLDATFADGMMEDGR